MQDEHKTDAQAAADAILSEYDLAVSPTVRRIIAYAYAKGMSAGIAECAEAIRKMASA